MGSALDQLEKQTLIMELQNERTKIEKFSENLEKYIASESLSKKLQLENIEYKSLSTIADKEYHYNLVERLTHISDSAYKNLSDEELRDLEDLRYLKNDLSTSN